MKQSLNFDKKAHDRWQKTEEARESSWDTWSMYDTSSVKQIRNPKFFHKTGRIPGVWSSKLKLDKRGRYTLINKHTKSTIKIPAALLTGFWKEIKI